MIIFTDIETTGLDEHKGSILEIAMVATNDNLEQIGEPFVSLVKPLHMRGYEVMDDFVYEMHTKSGLLTRLYEGHHGDTDAGWGRITPSAMAADLPRLGDVERAAIEWVLKTALRCVSDNSMKVIKGTPLAGNSVHFDKAWLRVHMDDLEKLFSHRIYDVSALNEFAKRHAPKVYAARPGLDANGKSEPKHRALDDVYASIETAKHYRDRLFKAH